MCFLCKKQLFQSLDEGEKLFFNGNILKYRHKISLEVFYTYVIRL